MWKNLIIQDGKFIYSWCNFLAHAQRAEGQRSPAAQSNLTVTSSEGDSCSLVSCSCLHILARALHQNKSKILTVWLCVVFLQNSVLDRLEPWSSKDRVLDRGRAEPQGGGVGGDRFAQRSHVWLFLRTGLLGWCRWGFTHPSAQHPGPLHWHTAWLLLFLSSGTKRLECVSPDGSGRRVIHPSVNYPFSMVYYRNHFYYTDWRR